MSATEGAHSRGSLCLARGYPLPGGTSPLAPAHRRNRRHHGKKLTKTAISSQRIYASAVAARAASIRPGAVQRGHGPDEASRSWPGNFGILMLYAVGHTKIGLPPRRVSRKPKQAPNPRSQPDDHQTGEPCQSRWLGSNMSLARGAKAHVTPSRACKGERGGTRMLIAILNQSTLVSNADAATMTQAVAGQIRFDAAPLWDRTRTGTRRPAHTGLHAEPSRSGAGCDCGR